MSRLLDDILKSIDEKGAPEPENIWALLGNLKIVDSDRQLYDSVVSFINGENDNKKEKKARARLLVSRLTYSPFIVLVNALCEASVATVAYYVSRLFFQLSIQATETIGIESEFLKNALASANVLAIVLVYTKGFLDSSSAEWQNLQLFLKDKQWTIQEISGFLPSRDFRSSFETSDGAKRRADDF